MIEKNLSRLINSFFESKVDRKRTHAEIICQIRAYAMNLKEEKGTSIPSGRTSINFEGKYNILG